MRLLVFAHRAEAQTFLKQANYKSLESKNFPIYKNEDSYLLICGEGIFNALESTTAALSKFEDIRVVLNFGIAGALDEQSELDSIVEIRTCYAILNDVVEFKSFSSTANTKLDCITSSSRALDRDKAIKLSPFANIVDRELWAIAKSSSNFSVDFRSFKLISDEPYKQESSESICEVVKDKAEYYSDKLYKKYLSLIDHPIVETKYLVEDYKDLYFTISQYRSYSTLLTQLLTKYDSEKSILELVELDKVLSLDLLPKQRTSVLLEKLRELLTPFNSKLQAQLATVLSPLHEARIKTTLSKNLEADQFKISATIQNEVELKKIARALTNLDYQSYKSLMRGNVDV